MAMLQNGLGLKMAINPKVGLWEIWEIVHCSCSVPEEEEGGLVVAQPTGGDAACRELVMM